MCALQGHFWEMHDLLFAHQDALEQEDLRGYAAELGLDVDRFGTPTLFIDGAVHRGGYDVQSLLEALAG